MSRKIILYIAVSLDGFIADAEGGVDWIEGTDKDYRGDYGYGSFIADIDTVIMGYTTYHQIVTELSPDEWFYKGMTSYILTHRDIPDTEEILFTDAGICSLTDQLKEQPGKDIWICGGADIVNQLVKGDRIDEYHITTMPLLLGQGTRLFDGSNPTILLDCTQSIRENGAVDSVYVRRNI